MRLSYDDCGALRPFPERGSPGLVGMRRASTRETIRLWRSTARLWTAGPSSSTISGCSFSDRWRTTGRENRNVQTDEALVEEFKRTGVRHALNELTVRHIAKIRSVVSQMILDQSRADDLTQEVFLRAYRGLPGFNGRARFSTWLYRVALNTVYGYLDRAGRSPVEFHAELPETVTSDGEPPDHEMMRSELADRIDAAMKRLSPSLRAAMVLTSVQGHAVSEAARIEGCNVGTMYWRVHKARKLLQRQLADYIES